MQPIIEIGKGAGSNLSDQSKVSIQLKNQKNIKSSVGARTPVQHLESPKELSVESEAEEEAKHDSPRVDFDHCSA